VKKFTPLILFIPIWLFAFTNPILVQVCFVELFFTGPSNPPLGALSSPREGQAPRSSNSVETRGPSPRACGALDSTPLGRSPPSPLSSFQPKHSRPRSLQYTVAAVTHTRLSQSHKTLSPLGTIAMACARAKGLFGFFKLTQLTRIHLEQAHKRSN
jgi:hypothetical protein